MTDPKVTPGPGRSTSQGQQARLFHPSLHRLPAPLRFVLSGVTGNAFFLVLYNMAYASLQSVAPASQIFSAVQLLCIVVNHFLNVGIVFGWPDDYLRSLAGNLPVGLVSLALGAATMGWTERVDLDGRVGDWISGGGDGGTVAEEEEKEKKGFWASIVVMIVTGIFNYVALNIVNASPKGKMGGKEKEL